MEKFKHLRSDLHGIEETGNSDTGVVQTLQVAITSGVQSRANMNLNNGISDCEKMSAYSDQTLEFIF